MKSLKTLAKLAEDWINVEPTTPEGFRKMLTRWYCNKYNCSFKDKTLLEHTIDELAVLFFIDKLEQDPHALAHITGSAKQDEEAFEDWIKEMMGDEYLSEEDSVKAIEEYEKQEKEIADQFPDDLSLEF